ncbi:MAG: site-2 protease family protein [Anaerolineaceae bacterium]|nr:site-2 protease family protein [Anaerolineaceae bacterium]
MKLGRFWGIPVSLHWSWFLIFVFLSGSLSLGYYLDRTPGLPMVAYWVLGALTSLLFFSAVLAHEFGHALTALHYHVPVERISLLIFGGVAHLSREPRTAKEEFLIALAGPMASLGCAALAGLLWLAAAHLPVLALLAGWLARINLALVVFNMIPGFPLDGGRIFRSIFWQITRDFSKATRLTGNMSIVVAYGFIGYGVLAIMQRNTVNGIWWAFIGWFLQQSSGNYARQSILQRSLGYEKVASLMSSEFSQISRNTSVSQLLDRTITEGQRNVVFVEDQGRLCGMLFLSDLTSLPRSRWENTSIEKIMSPLHPQAQLRPDASLLSAMVAMDQNHLTLLPVVIAGLPAGLISRERLLQYMQANAENNR